MIGLTTNLNGSGNLTRVCIERCQSKKPVFTKANTFAATHCQAFDKFPAAKSTNVVLFEKYDDMCAIRTTCRSASLRVNDSSTTTNMADGHVVEQLQRGERKHEFTSNGSADCPRPCHASGRVRRRFIHLRSNQRRLSTHHLGRNILRSDETRKLSRRDERESRDSKEVNPPVSQEALQPGHSSLLFQ